MWFLANSSDLKGWGRSSSLFVSLPSGTDGIRSGFFIFILFLVRHLIYIYYGLLAMSVMEFSGIMLFLVHVWCLGGTIYVYLPPIHYIHNLRGLIFLFYFFTPCLPTPTLFITRILLRHSTCSVLVYNAIDTSWIPIFSFITSVWYNEDSRVLQYNLPSYEVFPWYPSSLQIPDCVTFLVALVSGIDPFQYFRGIHTIVTPLILSPNRNQPLVTSPLFINER